VADHDEALALQPREAAYNRWVIPIHSISCQLLEVSEKPLYIVERMGSLRVPGQLCYLPRVKGCENLASEFVALGLESLNFTLKIQLTIPVNSAKFVYLGLKINDWLLKIEGSTH
jgi:hypothetical protein